MSRILVIAEQDGGHLKLATLSAIGFARKVCELSGGTFEILVAGKDVSAIAESLRPHGAAAVLVADDDALKNPVADRYAHVIAAVARERKASIVTGAVSTFSKDILPRTAALLDARMLSDVVDIFQEGDRLVFKRMMYAGNIIATVSLDGDVRVLTVRAAAFAPAPKSANPSPLVTVAVDVSPVSSRMEFVERKTKASTRPDPTEARVVVSGGRGVKNAEDFERLIGGLADAFGGAAGSSRALVDAGITPNSLQIGQTGKTVAPELYLAVGLSGAIQHLAGIKDAKVIVAMNKDPEAPIFEVADYGVVGDLYQMVPELIGLLKK